MVLPFVLYEYTWERVISLQFTTWFGMWRVMGLPLMLAYVQGT